MLSRSQKNSSFFEIKCQICTKSIQINTTSAYKKIPDKISNKVNADGKKNSRKQTSGQLIVCE